MRARMPVISSSALVGTARGGAQQYRPDIDGLRAIAALSVIGGHTGVLSGGFVGVDIFFVISGYLISGIILRALARERFSFFEFYGRRVRRIFPALVIILAAVTLLGWLLLLSDEYRQLGADVTAGAAFLVNFTKWWPDADLDVTIPRFLAHLWSLGVEEQFYLFWPLLLYVTWTWGKRGFIQIIALITALSFVVDVSLSSRNPWESFGVPWTRLWELSLGSLLACIHLNARDDPKPAQSVQSTRAVRWLRAASPNIQGLVGAGLLIVSILAIRTAYVVQFPGWWALVPCAGAFLLVSAGRQSWVNHRVLSAAPMVFVGLISYPLYLWHWPLLLFQTVWEPHPTPMMIAAAVAAAFVLSFCTYRFVEVPIRASSYKNATTALVFTATAICAIVGYAITSGTISARPAPVSIDRFVAAARDDQTQSALNTSWTLHPSDFMIREAGHTYAMYIGDSSMRQYYPRVDKLLSDYPLNRRGAVFAVRNRCAPGAVEVAQLDADSREICRKFIASALEYARGPAVDTVVIGACWYLHFLRSLGDTVPLKPGSDRALQTLRETIVELVSAGKRVYVLLDMPVGTGFDPRQMIRRTLTSPGFVVDISTPKRAAVESVLEPIRSRMIRTAGAAGATLIDPMDWLCNGTTCPAVSSHGEPLYQDAWTLRAAYVREHARFIDHTLLTLESPGEQTLSAAGSH